MENIMLPRPYKILKILKETNAEYTFRVECDPPEGHGQFFQLSIPKIGEAPISVSGKGEGYVEFTIRKIGRLTEGIFGLSENDTLFMRGPYGNAWPLEKLENGNLVVVCGGTGMAAVRTLLNHFYHNPEIRNSVHLLAGFKNAESVLFAEELEKFRLKFNTVYTLDDMEAPGFNRGLVTEYLKGVPFGALGDYNVIIVGPPAMLRFAALECLANGVEKSRIWVALERKMSCAVGKCGHCKINEVYVCLEGPVCNYTQTSEMFD